MVLHWLSSIGPDAMYQTWSYTSTHITLVPWHEYPTYSYGSARISHINFIIHC
ncbi:hypothetical protein F383_27384 [Gossypium arboreum]|uniref:Uncharacterized protein n=1 Tax=Gossypium arboreum TaxID=29729 RepID=A0A0B0MRH0_GOSAR|nr:hypothetical protein F383_27384 [Gossypium arboreum]